MNLLHQREKGFSLLEILVAFTILTISLGTLFAIFSHTTIVAIASAQYSRATTLAEAKLATVGIEIPLEKGITSGEANDGFTWEINIVPTKLNPDAFFEPTTTPYLIYSSVLWKDAGKAHRLTLTAIQLGATTEGEDAQAISNSSEQE